jgi:hypothetical protein
MRKLLQFVLVSGLGSSPAQGDSELGIMIEGGPDMSTLSHDNRVNRFGFSGGVAAYLDRTLAERFSLAGQVELLYTGRGADVVFNGDSLGGLRQHYLDIMLAARPEARLGLASVYLLLGGGVNLLAKASDEDATGMSQDVTGDLRRLDVSLLVGAGTALHFSRRDLGPFQLGAIFVEVRHGHGLIDIDPMDGGFKNRTTSLMLGLSIVLSSRESAVQAATP